MTDPKKEALDFIIDNKKIKTVFQPIVSLKNGSVLGHEALSRITCESTITDPEMLFGAAAEFNRLWDLELLCRTTALETAFRFMVPPYANKLFINVNPDTMHDENFKKGFTKSFLLQYKITPRNIIFEITEKNSIVDINGFRSTINHYKNQEYKIAIDDVGAGFAGLNLISDVNPNYIKLDMKLTRDIDNDSLKYAIVKSMVELSKISNIYLIAEGIETFAELNTLIHLGVQYGQGFYIQKPDEKIKEIPAEIILSIKEINMEKNHSIKNHIASGTVKYLSEKTDTISPTERASSVYDKFKQNTECFGMTVIENGIPIGIITRDKLALRLSGNYGYTLYQNKPISDLMDKYFLSVDQSTPISVVSNMAMSRTSDRLYDFIVVTENDKYLGTVTIKVLLQKSTELEVIAAKHQNPLSGLPGNVIIDQRLGQCVSGDSKYSVAYLDIHNFKAFNDVYGFENGDLVILKLADLLKHYIPEEYFIGHVGGDDFIVIVNDHITENYFWPIVEQFCSECLEFYNETDRENGYITTSNRHGVIEHFPLITLTCVVVNNKDREFGNVYDLTEILAEQKKTARKKPAEC